VHEGIDKAASARLSWDRSRGKGIEDRIRAGVRAIRAKGSGEAGEDVRGAEDGK
jgi:hypothetical protein